MAQCDVTTKTFWILSSYIIVVNRRPQLIRRDLANPEPEAPRPEFYQQDEQD